MKYLVSFIVLTVSVALAYVPKKKHEILVMVIDTGIAYHEALVPYVKYDKGFHYQDSLGHGTHVTGIIIYGNTMVKDSKFDSSDALCDNVRIISCNFFGKDSLKREVECIKTASNMGVDYINISSGGEDFDTEEYNALNHFVKSGGTVVVAAGNEGKSLQEKSYYPASYAVSEGVGQNKPIPMYVVSNIKPNGQLVSSSNFHPLIFQEVGYNIVSTYPGNIWGSMTGTSQAAPQKLHKLLKKKCEEL